jgi:two-component system CheB/CheR fusion protein
MYEAKRVLVVDDNKDAADTLAKVLRNGGHEVQVSYGGKSAIEMAREQKPHVILLDLAMPGMDGFTVTQNLRQHWETKGALIIAVTGYGLPGDRARSDAAGIDLHLVKPVDGNKLLKLFCGGLTEGT